MSQKTVELFREMAVTKKLCELGFNGALKYNPKNVSFI